MTIGQSTIGQSTLGHQTIGQSTLGQATIGQWTLGQVTIGQSTLGQWDIYVLDDNRPVDPHQTIGQWIIHHQTIPHKTIGQSITQQSPNSVRGCLPLYACTCGCLSLKFVLWFKWFKELFGSRSARSAESEQ